MTVEEIARLLGGTITGDAKRQIRAVAALETARADEVAFAEGERACAQAVRSGAGCILVSRGIEVAGHTTLEVERPKVALIRVAEALHPPVRPLPGIHPSAVVADNAEIAPDASIGARATIGERVKVGSGTRVGEAAILGADVQVGSRCTLYPHVTIYPGSRLGDRVVLHSGVVIGSDGFGYVFAEGRHQKFPQLGTVVIENDVEIGANSTVDRGSLGTTVIGEGSKIDNLVQIAHNVKIGRHTVIAAQTGISGRVEIGDYVVIAGQVGIGERARIEDRAVIGGQAGILPGKVVRRGSIVWGTPARPLAEFKRLHAARSRLPEWIEKLQKL